MDILHTLNILQVAAIFFVHLFTHLLDKYIFLKQDDCILSPAAHSKITLRICTE